MEEVTKAKFSFKPVCKPNQLICGTGQIAIATGWTKMELVARKLEPEHYAAIGPFYSPTRGLSYLLRNLLANPHVRYLLILDATAEDKKAGGCQCLLDFFLSGFYQGISEAGRDCWIVNSPIKGYVDICIEQQSLEQLRASVTVMCIDNLTDLKEIASAWSASERPPWGGPQFFPVQECVPVIFPGPRYGHRIEGRTFAETWVKIIHRIKRSGVVRDTQHDSKWQELVDLMAIVTDEPEDFFFPEPNYLPCDRSFLNQYIPSLLNDDNSSVEYTYGQRLRSWFGVDQIERTIFKLIADIDTARCAMTLWDAQKDGGEGSSPPCLNHIWVRVVDNELSLTATFRSNDMFSAWVLNAMTLRALQRHIRDAIAAHSQYDLKMGPLITISQSAHIYDDCWEYADRLIREQYPKIASDRTYDDPQGNFVISVEGKEIVVEQTTPGSGEPVFFFRGRSARSLYREIAADCPALQVEHALYLGIELRQAEYALSQGLEYRQDAVS
jgi:thymidylate synthase